MRITVVADVHGNYDALARTAETAGRTGRLVILGDLLDYVDYHDPAAGIVGAIFGIDAALHFTRLRAAGAFVELHRFDTRLWESISDPVGLLSEIVQQRYRKVVDAIGPDALVTLGNVDVVDEWVRVAGPDMPYRDGEAVEIDGVRIGFVAGGVTRRPRPVGAEVRAWRPFLRPADEYRSAVAAMGPVDILCSHIPPDLAVLRYDVVPARLEMAGPGLLGHIDEYQPALALSGHVHQPLASRCRRGTTECLNAGHFQRSEHPLVIDLDRVPRRAADTAFARSRAGR